MIAENEMDVIRYCLAAKYREISNLLMSFDDTDDYRDEAIAELAEIDAARAYLDSLPTMPQPDWNRAPEWAQYWCVDADGYISWFSIEPYRFHADPYWSPDDEEPHAMYIGDVNRQHRIDLPLGIDWRQTLQRRPEQTGA